MCADNASPRQSSGPGRHRRNTAVTGQALGLTATSPLRSTYHVGRVGALAVALGVGTAILGFTATAAAETGRGDAAGSAGEESSRSGNSRTAPANNRPGNRRNAPAAAKDAAPASAPDVPTIEAANGGTVPTTALRRSAGRSALTDQSAEARNTTPDALAETATSADSPVPASLPSSDGAAGMVDDSAPSPVADLLSAVSSGDALAQAAATPEIAAAPQIPSASAAQQAPVMTAAPADALAEADADPSALLGAGGVRVDRGAQLAVDVDPRDAAAGVSVHGSPPVGARGSAA